MYVDSNSTGLNNENSLNNQIAREAQLVERGFEGA
jgi:hypothetical protein